MSSTQGSTKIRSKIWSTGEDEALCAAWLNTSQNPVTGTNQKIETFYERVYEAFIETCTERDLACEPGLRVPSGIKARWLTISKACGKFAGCLAQINARNQSGSTPQDRFKQAQELYRTTTKAPFNMLHCFKLLENAPKWQLYEKTKDTTLKRKHSEEPTNLEDFNETLPTTTPERPPRLKTSQKLVEAHGNMAKSGYDLAKAAMLVADAAKEKSALSKERTIAINRLADVSVMAVDFSKISDTARRYMYLEQNKILASLRAEIDAKELLNNDSNYENSGELSQVNSPSDGGKYLSEE